MSVARAIAAAYCCIGLAGAAIGGPTLRLQVRSDLAPRVNVVLARFAAPETVRVPLGREPLDYLKGRCGGVSPSLVGAPAVDHAGAVVTMIPCVRFNPPTSVTARKDSSLAELSERLGLPSGLLAKLRNAGNWSWPASTKVHSGDKIQVPQTPDWTRVVLRDDAGGLSAFVDALARAVDCPKQSALACMTRKHVALIEGGEGRGTSVEAPPPAAPKSSVPPSATSSPAAPPVNTPQVPAVFGGRVQPASFQLVSASVSPAIRNAVRRYPEAVSIATFDAQAGATVASVPAPPSSGIAGEVAVDQWPYDIARTSRVLLLAKQQGHLIGPIAIGVADNGLREKDGQPLTDAMLYQSPSGDHGSYIGDVHGAGPARSGTTAIDGIKGIGDLGLCDGGLDTSKWPADAIEYASHGSVVASIAAGRGLRQAEPQLDALLPKVAFFRLLNQCTPEKLSPDAGTVQMAFEYFYPTIKIVSLSYEIQTLNLDSFRSQAASALDGDGQILVVASGDDGRLLALETPACPICLLSYDQINVKKRVFAVGAAQRDLSRATYSNFGPGVVSFFAPGEPAGAVQIEGAPADGFAPWTSYSAPLVSLAIALLNSNGVTSPDDIRELLKTASWPLRSTEALDTSGAWVVDLLKVAAVRSDVVERLVKDPDNIVRRHTYVGAIDLAQNATFRFCSEFGFGRGDHAIRIEPAIGKNRTYVIRGRQVERTTRKYGERRGQCTAADGTVSILDVLGQKIDIPYAEVSEIIFNWK